MNNKQRQYPFTSPVVPSADVTDGLLTTATLDQPVLVNIFVWDGARPGDTVQLLLNQLPVSQNQIVSDADKPGDIIQLQLEPELLEREGTYDLAFKATNHENLASDISPFTSITVDRTPPGAALLAPMILPGATLGDRLTALLPGYAGMALGDVIQTRCNGMSGPSYTVEAEDLNIRPIEIHFKREDFKATGEDHLTLDYIVTDRAGNVSQRSVPKLLTLQM